MITVSVNGQHRQCEPQAPLAEHLLAWGFACDKIAVAINGGFLPRSQYDEHRLSDGDQLDVLAPVQGG